MKKHRVLTYPLSTQRRLWSDCTDAQADLSLRWAHSHFVGFVVMTQIIINLNFSGNNGKEVKSGVSYSFSFLIILPPSVEALSSQFVFVLRFYGSSTLLRSCRAGQLTYLHCSWIPVGRAPTDLEGPALSSLRKLCSASGWRWLSLKSVQ